LGGVGKVGVNLRKRSDFYAGVFQVGLAGDNKIRVFQSEVDLLGYLPQRLPLLLPHGDATVVLLDCAVDGGDGTHEVGPIVSFAPLAREQEFFQRVADLVTMDRERFEDAVNVHLNPVNAGVRLCAVRHLAFDFQRAVLRAGRPVDTDQVLATFVLGNWCRVTHNAVFS
jgi:hypothetical protein